MKPNLLAEFFDHEKIPGEHLSLVQRSTILAVSAIGLDAKQVAVVTNCDVRTVKHWVEHHETTGSIEDDPGRGRKKITIETQDDNIVRSAQDTPITTPRIIRSRLGLIDRAAGLVDRSIG